MKRNELTEIKGLDLKELKSRAETIKEEIASLVMDKNMKKLKDLKSVSKKRKDLAQVLTVLRQKQLLVKLESGVQNDSERLRKPESQNAGVFGKSDSSDVLSPSEISGKSERRVKKGAKK